MKNNKIKLLSLVALFSASVFTLSCSTDDAQNDSVIDVNNGSASLAAVSPYLVTTGINNVNEGGLDKTIEYSVNLAVAQPVDTYVKVSLVPGGSATLDDDFEFDTELVIPRWQTSAVGTVTILGDAIDEEDESFSITFSDEFDAQIAVQNSTLSFNITDFGDLTIGFDWNQPIPGFPFTLCDVGYDNDIYLFDANGDDVSGFQAATGACPEEMVISLADVEDGVYTLEQNVYDDATLASVGITPAFAIPVTVTYSRANSSFAGSFVQLAADAVDSDFGNVAGYDSQYKYIATLTVANGLFTFSQNGTNIATGRMYQKSYVKPVKEKSSRRSFFK